MKRTLIIGAWLLNGVLVAYMAMLYINSNNTVEAFSTVDYPAADQTAISMAVTEAIYYGYNNKNKNITKK